MDQSVANGEVCPLESAKLTEPEAREASNREDGGVLVACRVANHWATSAALGTQPTAEIASAVKTPVTT